MRKLTSGSNNLQTIELWLGGKKTQKRDRFRATPTSVTLWQLNEFTSSVGQLSSGINAGCEGLNCVLVWRVHQSRRGSDIRGQNTCALTSR